MGNIRAYTNVFMATCVVWLIYMVYRSFPEITVEISFAILWLMDNVGELLEVGLVLSINLVVAVIVYYRSTQNKEK